MVEKSDALNAFDKAIEALEKLRNQPNDTFIAPVPSSAFYRALMDRDIVYHDGKYWYYGIQVVPYPDKLSIPEEEDK